MRKPVPDAVKKSDFSVRAKPGSSEKAIYYKGVPVWDTVDERLDEYDFFLAERDYMWGDTWELTCKDGWGDHYSYGRWTTLEAALSWLRNPRL